MTTETTNRPADPVTRHPGVVIIFLVICLLLISGDLLLKWWAFAHMTDQRVDVAAVVAGEALLPHTAHIVVPNVLGMKLMLNRGAVFGIGQGQIWLFLSITVIALGVISFMFARSDRRDRILHIVLTLILAGAVGNMVDRITFTAVRDMLWLFPGVKLPFGWQWPGSVGGSDELYPWVFNLADVYLVFGIGVLAVRTLLSGPKPTSETE